MEFTTSKGKKNNRVCKTISLLVSMESACVRAAVNLVKSKISLTGASSVATTSYCVVQASSGSEN